MTKLSRPTPSYRSQPQQETVATSITLQLGPQSYLSKYGDGGDTSVISVEAIRDSTGQLVEAVWNEDWTEISPGIRTKQETIEIQRSACPVLISFVRKRDGWQEDKWGDVTRSTNSDRFQIRYEQE